MRKVFSLALAFLVVFSISGCAWRNNGGTGVRRLSERNYISGTNVNYRDGVYTGYGDSHGNTNEMAVVEIRNGRIVNVNLANVNQQRSGMNNQRGTNTGLKNQNGTRDQIGPSNGITSGTGTNNTTGYGNTLTPGTGNTTGMRANNQGGTNNLVGSGNGITYGSTAGTGNPSGTRNTTGTGRNNSNAIVGGTTGGVAGTALDGARNNLVNAMIQNQRYDVNIANNNVGLVGTISNWKLAVSRALAQARR